MKQPKVGIGVIVLKGDKVLIGKRSERHGRGHWGFCGGGLEFGEEIHECAAREALEEAGIHIKDIKIVAVTNDFFEESQKHYLTIFVTAKHHKGRPRPMDPAEIEHWEWTTWDKLPSPLFLPIRNLLKKKFNPFEKSILEV